MDGASFAVCVPVLVAGVVTPAVRIPEAGDMLGPILFVQAYMVIVNVVPMPARFARPPIGERRRDAADDGDACAASAIPPAK